MEQMRALKVLVVRAGCELTSERVGEVQAGSIVSVEQVVRSDEGKRARIEQGWVSIVTQEGNVVLEPTECVGEDAFRGRASEKLLRRASGRGGVRCCAAVNGAVWAGERVDGITVRHPQTGSVQQQLGLSGLAWSLLAVGHEVWVGTEAGPIVVFDGRSHERVREQRQHCGGVHCLADDGLGGAGGRDGPGG